ncbi:anaerobic sulfatase maturase [Endozoicomonas sp. (ex Bugula neritina AB1)]|nr:anaerobic sulfatase maturase [Endozoicomonas sp. (ex Bugula neritina AB1)]
MRQPFHLMAKPTSYQCNLDCDYCFYLEKEQYYKPRGKDKITAMNNDVLRDYIKQYIASQDTQEVNFAWQGGEPTTAGLDFFRKVIKYQQKFAHGKKVSNSLQTNGVLINDEWATFLKEHEFLVGVSVDGPREIHDYYRVSQGGKPTFNKVMKGIEALKRHSVEYNTLTVVNNVNIEKPIEVYNFLKSIGSTFLQFIPIVEQQEVGITNPSLIFPAAKTEKRLMPFAVQSGDEYGRFMITIFDEWVKKDVGKIYVQAFEEALSKWAGYGGSLCLFQEKCGQAMVIERNGDIYSCDHYVYPEYRLGNILEEKMTKLATSKLQRKFGDDKANVGKHCTECEFRFACHGGCPKHRIHDNDDGTRQNHLCSGYYNLFKHINPYMKYMVNELRQNRSPMNIMRQPEAVERFRQ